MQYSLISTFGCLAGIACGVVSPIAKGGQKQERHTRLVQERAIVLKPRSVPRFMINPEQFKSSDQANKIKNSGDFHSEACIQPADLDKNQPACPATTLSGIRTSLPHPMHSFGTSVPE